MISTFLGAGAHLHVKFPANAKHLYNICTMLDQRRRRWADIVQILYKCFVFAGNIEKKLVDGSRTTLIWNVTKYYYDGALVFLLKKITRAKCRGGRREGGGAARRILVESRRCISNQLSIICYQNGTYMRVCMYMMVMQTTLPLIDQLHILHKHRPWLSEWLMSI